MWNLIELPDAVSDIQESQLLAEDAPVEVLGECAGTVGVAHEDEPAARGSQCRAYIKRYKRDEFAGFLDNDVNKRTIKDAEGKESPVYVNALLLDPARQSPQTYQINTMTYQENTY